jgi:lysophospholipase L1-like esterase
MMLGDSITATTCYPQLVYQDLRTAGHTNFTFIGGIINNQSCGVSGLPSGGLRTEGHSGELVVTDTNNGSILNWFKANPPDIVVMHFATNDVWGNPGQSTATGVLNAYTTVLANLRSVNPSAILFVAQIIPMNPSLNGCSTANPCHYEATLDAGIPAWVTAHTTAASPVYAVNLENLYNNGYFPNSTYTSDGVHPSLAGSQPMGTTMSAAMIAQVPSL